MSTSQPDHFLAYVLGAPAETEVERISREAGEVAARISADCERQTRNLEAYHKIDPHKRAAWAVQTMTKPASTPAERQSAHALHQFALAEIDLRQKAEAAFTACDPPSDARH